jgi:hypothetical protein
MTDKFYEFMRFCNKNNLTTEPKEMFEMAMDLTKAQLSAGGQVQVGTLDTQEIFLKHLDFVVDHSKEMVIKVMEIMKE